MAAPVRPAPTFRLDPDAIRDVCARPAVLEALAAALPANAVRGPADRRAAIADGIARALEAALGATGDTVLLEEAERRMWEPVGASLARILHRAGPDGLFAYLVVEGAARREAWRADTARRRATPLERLPIDAVGHDDREPLDLDGFRLAVERSLDATASRIGLADDMVYDVLAGELSYAEAGRRTGRSPNALWMALQRVRPDWHGVAERGRAAGLGGGVLVRLADGADAAVRRAVRWRLVGGVAAVALVAGALGVATLSARLGGDPLPRNAEPVLESVEPGGSDPLGPAGRILALEAARRIAAAKAPRSTAGAPARRGAARPRRSTPAGTAAVGGSSAPPVAAAADASSVSCGLGSAALACR